MKIAIIGSGNVGAALARASARAGHAVVVTSTDRQEAARVASETGAQSAETNAAAVAGAEMVVLAVPFDAVAGIVGELGASLQGKVLVDVTNRFAAEQLGAPSNAEIIQASVPGAHVVKAINTVFAAYQANPKAEGIQLDGYVAGDDADAKKKALAWVESIGFRPIDTGSLAMARALEGMGTLNISLNMNHKWSWQTAWKLLGPTG